LAVRELRIHGRGGQGAVIASKLLAVALFREGNDVQAFPAFGVERRGAPVTAFLRFDDRPIRLRCEITEPDDLVVLDPTLVEAVDVSGGLKPGGTILINSERAPDDYPSLSARFRIATVDASGIAVRHGLGTRSQPIVNTAIVGAASAVFGWFGMPAVEAAIEEEVPAKLEANVAAAREAAGAVRVADAREISHV
jgi:pyruvate ferredoxin oxidoreductase gamma subunit/2-oxoisovalerate ferredoxin oxidoreductase gamma subunit